MPDKAGEENTLFHYIKNQGRQYVYENGQYLDEGSIDIIYEGVGYQITNGDTQQLGVYKRAMNLYSKFSGMRNLSMDSYAKMCLEGALKNKRMHDGQNVTLLIDCTYSSWLSLQEREGLFVKYFHDNEKELGGSWKSIVVICMDGNILLR